MSKSSASRRRPAQNRKTYQMPPATIVDVDPLHRHRYIERLSEKLLGTNKSYAEKIDRRLVLLCHRNSEAYMDKMTQLLYNLQQRPNLASEYEPEIIVSLDDVTLDKSSPALQLREVRQRRETSAKTMLDILTAPEPRTVTDNRSSIRCSECKSYDIDVDNKQTRGADEAMTIFCTCRNINCGASWTIDRK